MSYDVSFKVKTKEADRYRELEDPELDTWINYTSNTAKIIEKVCGSFPSKWDDKKASELIPILEKGISELTEHPEKYKIYEPRNGWGNIPGTRNFLGDILNVCRKHPEAVVCVDC